MYINHQSTSALKKSVVLTLLEVAVELGRLVLSYGGIGASKCPL